MAKEKTVIHVQQEEVVQKKFLKKVAIFLGISVVLEYVFPYVLMLAFWNEKDYKQYMGIAILLMMGVYPVVMFMASFIHTRYDGFRKWIPLVYAGFYVPAALLFFNCYGLVAVGFALLYATFGYFGCLGAYMTLRRIERQRNKKASVGYGKKSDKSDKQRRVRGRNK